jgi:hypothetical protein
MQDNIKTYVKEMEYDGMNWVHLAQDRVPVAGSSERVNEFSSSIEDGEFLDEFCAC